MLSEALALVLALAVAGLAVALWTSHQRRAQAEAARRQSEQQLGAHRQRTDAELDQLRALLDQVQRSGEARQAELTRQEADARQRYEALAPRMEDWRNLLQTARRQARPLGEGLAELQAVQTTFERWHEGMDALLQQNADMHRKNEDFAQIVRQMTIVTLNASIEAARIGELGKGFAVVAEEMRGLAKRAEKLSGDYRRGLHENDLLTTSTFQDIQASGKLIVGTIAALDHHQREVQGSLEEAGA